jgi:uncharacterized protein YggU (UPF0235/DUF167 family)
LSSAPPSPFAAAKGGVRVAVRLTPRAAADRVGGLAADADGGVALKAGVTAVPEKGRANAALLKLLAKEWRVPRSALEIVSGTADRRKVVLVAGDAAELLQRLSEWMERHG